MSEELSEQRYDEDGNPIHFYDGNRAEIERLKAALASATERAEKLQQSYEAKVQDLSRETLRVSVALQACDKGNGARHPGNKWCTVGEAGLGWNAALEWVEENIHIVAYPEAD